MDGVTGQTPDRAVSPPVVAELTALLEAVCDCGDFNGHPGDCAATPLIRLLADLAATRARAEAAEAVVANVRALADEWDERRRPGMVGISTRLRAVLDAAPSGDPEDGPR